MFSLPEDIKMEKGTKLRTGKETQTELHLPYNDESVTCSY